VVTDVGSQIDPPHEDERVLGLESDEVSLTTKEPAVVDDPPYLDPVPDILWLRVTPAQLAACLHVDSVPSPLRSMHTSQCSTRSCSDDA